MSSLVVLFSTGAGAEPSSDLSQFLWKNRILLVFSPDSEHQHWRAQQSEIQENEAGFAERQLLLIPVVGSPEHPLRQRFGVPANEFAALLIGKDGGVKARQGQALTAAQLFGRIDAMPMRIQEMREQRP